MSTAVRMGNWDPGRRRGRRCGTAGLLAGAAILLGGAAILLGGCSSGRPSTLPLTLPATAVATSSTTTVPPTTVFQPSAPQASREAAAQHLVTAWRGGDRAAAMADAAPAAVTTVFGQPFPKAGAQFRQCSQSVAGPSFCAYRVDNGLLDLAVVAVTGGWSVDSVTFES